MPPWGWQSAAPVAITPDSMLYVSYGVSLYAFKLPSGPAESGWPMFQHDARRTGRVSAAR
jgi:hypothetical protein